MNAYALYLVQDMVTKRLASLGLNPAYVMTSRDYENIGTRGWSVHVKVNTDADGQYMSAVEREQRVVDFMAAYPDAALTREASWSGGRPEMKLRGVTNLGFAWEVDFGTGVCEQVQVGTKRVKTFDPEALAAVPMVERDEPVFEYMCPDPLRDAVTA